MKLKEAIIEKYGSIDRFLETPDLGIGRTYLFTLLYGDANPTVKVIARLSEVLGIPVEELVDEFSNRHRN